MTLFFCGNFADVPPHYIMNTSPLISYFSQSHDVISVHRLWAPGSTPRDHSPLAAGHQDATETGIGMQPFKNAHLFKPFAISFRSSESHEFYLILFPATSSTIIIRDALATS